MAKSRKDKHEGMLKKGWIPERPMYGLCQNYEYDWVTPGSRRTPEEYPYSYDDFFVWKIFDEKKDRPSCFYTDRLYQHNGELYSCAVAAIGGINPASLIAARMRLHSTEYVASTSQKFIDVYFNGKYTCVAYAMGCNQSSGYPYGIFYVMEKNDGVHQDQ